MPSKTNFYEVHYTIVVSACQSDSYYKNTQKNCLDISYIQTYSSIT